MTKTADKQEAKNLPIAGSKLIATADNDITISFWNDVLPLQDPTIDAKAPHLGLALYDEVYRDGRIRSAINKRTNKLIKREWSVEPASEDERDIAVADLGRSVLNDLAFDKMCKALNKAILKGFAIIELLWGRNDDGYIVPVGFKDHNQIRFVFDKQWQPRLLTREAISDGIKLPKRKFIVHRFDAEGNNPYGLGLGATLFWHVLFKREGVAFWMTFLEKFASPTPVIKYVEGTTDEKVRAHVSKVKKMVQSGAVAMPLGFEIDYLEASRAGEAGYEKWNRYWDEQSAELINGETLSTNIGDKGAKAAAETHAEEGDGLVDGDADLMSATLNATLMVWITELNFADAKPPQVWRARVKNEIREEALKTSRAKRQQEVLKLLASLKAAGFVPKDLNVWLEEQMEVELDELDPKLVAEARSMLRYAKADNENRKPSPEEPDQTEEDDSEASQFAEDEDAISHLVEQLVAIGDPAFDDLLDRARLAFSEARDYDDLSARLLGLVEGRDHEQFARLFGDALALAELQGRGEIYDETGIHANWSKEKGSKKNF